MSSCLISHLDSYNKRYTFPEYWEDNRFNRPNQPVVGVCWYEARAYCCWLTSQTGMKYKLPTEAEWVAAARRGRTDRYVYGEEFELLGGNMGETRLARTTSVGLFTLGMSPEGLYDLSGNVSEWTSTRWGENRIHGASDYPFPYEPNDGREIDEGSYRMNRITRSSAWNLGKNSAVVAYRDHCIPSERYSTIGFRLVRSL